VFVEKRRSTFMVDSGLVVEFCGPLMRGHTPSPMTLVVGVAHPPSVSHPARADPGPRHLLSG
jgi:hypothetical protein